MASITFSPIGTEKVAEAMDILGICYDMLNFVHYYADDDIKNLALEYKVTHSTIEPDISRTEFNENLGFFNFYMGDEIPAEAVKQIIDAYNQYKLGDIEIRFEGVEKSGIRGNNVARLQVVKNETANYGKIPEMNISNFSAAKLFEILQENGINVNPRSYSGILDAEEVKEAIGRLKKMPFLLKEKERPGSISKNTGVVAYESDYTLERYDSYLNGLMQIINYIEKNNLPKKGISYA
ncbi:MAG: hypothetical protein WDA06_01325 [Phenylobacterium sp.]